MSAEEDDGSEWGIGAAAVEALTPDEIVTMSKVDVERLTPRDLEFMSVEQLCAVQAHPRYRKFSSASQVVGSLGKAERGCRKERRSRAQRPRSCGGRSEQESSERGSFLRV